MDKTTCLYTNLYYSCYEHYTTNKTIEPHQTQNGNKSIINLYCEYLAQKFFLACFATSLTFSICDFTDITTNNMMKSSKQSVFENYLSYNCLLTW